MPGFEEEKPDQVSEVEEAEVEKEREPLAGGSSFDRPRMPGRRPRRPEPMGRS